MVRLVAGLSNASGKPARSRGWNAGTGSGLSGWWRRARRSSKLGNVVPNCTVVPASRSTRAPSAPPSSTTIRSMMVVGSVSNEAAGKPNRVASAAATSSLVRLSPTRSITGRIRCMVNEP